MSPVCPRETPRLGHCRKYLIGLVRPIGLEPITFGSGGRRSIQLSYGRTKRKYNTLKNGVSAAGLAFRDPGADTLSMSKKKPARKPKKKPRLDANEIAARIVGEGTLKT